MYADIDLDASGMEVEFRRGLNKLLNFVNAHISHLGLGDFENEKIEIIFNKDILVNESQTIDNCAKSLGILSDETIISQHPWVKDPLEEIKKIKKQKDEETEEYDRAFKNRNGSGGVDEEE